MPYSPLSFFPFCYVQMDLLSSETKKTGTRGGRGNFSWDAVNDDERQYYLGNSIAKPLKSRSSSAARDPEWYAKPSMYKPPPRPPSSVPPPPHPTLNASNLTSASAAADIPTGAVAAAAFANDLQVVRRREKAIMERMIVGRSFADAVRSALTESVGSGVDDEGGRDAAAAAARRAVRRREKTERTQRKDMRDRVRELRRIRRAGRTYGATTAPAPVAGAAGGKGGGYGERSMDQQQQRVMQHDSSESERENWRNRMGTDGRRRRRRRERESMTKKRPSEWSTTDSENSERRRNRRRLR